MTERIPILYLAPWVVYGGSDKNTIDWFRWIDRDRFTPSLITTQPSPNPLLGEVTPFAEEAWVLPDLMPAEQMPEFIFDFLQSRDIRVIHLMNSRLGFDLLPDLACLPNPPSVVVQLHVEEADKSGYVRYVTTRYGNLVDRFSISNQHVAGAVKGYGIPDEKVRVIYTGVDAEEEFSPDLATPIEDLADDCLQILFAARLVEQKDPLLMVEVATALRERGVRYQLHVVGDGELEKQLKQRVAERKLTEQVKFHPPTPGLQGWYAACDTLLLTSKFEGVPCVLFEAMAMGMPIVAPDLPGIRELLDDDDDNLIAQRDSVQAYVEALARLADDPERRDALGNGMRDRAKKHFSVQQMAASHGELYEELFAAQKKAPAEPSPSLPAPMRFCDRPVAGKPRVSVLVPHFNQSRFLGECVESIQAQSYPDVEIVVVDDASTEHGAAAVLDELGNREGVTVIRQAENRGPSHARNVGLESCSGRYVLPMDADNLLLPEALEKLVEQLSAAGEDVGFVYPNIQYFGNREDYYEVPEYNLYTLLYGNFCDTCSLLDREIFDAGIRYSEEIRLGHEDWEFFLRLAAHGVRGEGARVPTVRYRKWGFNRSDLVDHAPDDFRDDVLAKISPFRGRETEIKAQESPSLSIVPLSVIDVEGDAGRELASSLSAQSCIDVELVGRFDGEWPLANGLPPTRRLPATLAASPFEAVRQGLERARGSFVAVTAGTARALLADPAFVAKVLGRFAAAGDELDAIALVDAGADGGYSFSPAPPDREAASAKVHTVIWRRRVEQVFPWGLHADLGDPIPSLLQQLSGAGAQVEWRHLPFLEPGADLTPTGDLALLPGDPANATDPNGIRPAARPLLPGAGKYRVPRWALAPTWTPPLSTLAIRYREHFGEGRLTTSGQPPQGYVAEHHLGALRSTALEGTTRIVRIGDQYRAIPRGEWHSAPSGAEEIGYAELAHLPGMDVLAVAVHRTTGQQLLVTLPGDPILGSVDVIAHLGCLDPFPLRPRETPATHYPLGLAGLAKGVDYDSRRHRYAVGKMPPGELIEELGALAGSELQGSIPVWIVDDYLVTERHRQPSWKSGTIAALRWAAEPAAWRSIAPPVARAKVMARRSVIGAKSRTRVTPLVSEPSGAPAGWLFESERPGRVPLFASYHPVTGDQLLTRSTEDAAQMGYIGTQLLGFLRRLAPLTGDLEHRHLSVPWARRFGSVPQTG